MGSGICKLCIIGALACLHVVAIWSPFRNKRAFLGASHDRFIAQNCPLECRIRRCNPLGRGAKFIKARQAV